MPPWTGGAGPGPPRLLRRVNELADAENLPCYLFTTSVPGTSSKQVAIYSRFGYEKVEERTIADAAGTRGSVTCYAMVRKAAAYGVECRSRVSK